MLHGGKEEFFRVKGKPKCVAYDGDPVRNPWWFPRRQVMAVPPVAVRSIGVCKKAWQHEKYQDFAVRTRLSNEARRSSDGRCIHCMER